MKMPHRSLLGLVVLCSVSQIVCHKCTWDLLRSKHSKTLQTLREMGEELPKDCFTEKDIQIKSELPKKVYGHHLQEGDDVKTVYETFLQIKNIFNKKLISVSWDQKNIESLKIVLHRQTSVLEDCVKTWTRNTKLKNNKKVKKHFKKLGKYLKDKKYSRCAWEMVRNEIKTLLQQVYKLMVKL